MTYKRQCPNWLETYRSWIYPRSQLRTELIDWSGIYTLAVVLKRQVAITRTSGFLGGWDCYPYLYIIAVGPAGIGKTTAVRYSFDLTDQVPNLAKPPTFYTMEAIVDSLVNAPGNSVYLSIEELEDAFQKDYRGKLFGFLTSMYDGKVALSQKTMERDLEFADKPSLNIFAGTTPQWVSDNIPPGILNGGFGSRVIWLYVPDLRRRRMYYREEMQTIDFLSIEKKLVADLVHIATLEGEYTITNEAMDYVEKWNEEIPNRIQHQKIAGYIMRKSVFVHKLAMLMHIAYSDTMELNLLDFKNAISLIEGLEPNLPIIFQGVGKNEYVMDMREIAKYIAENPGISEQDLKKVFRATSEPWKLSGLIEGLLEAGIVESKMNGRVGRMFYFKED